MYIYILAFIGTLIESISDVLLKKYTTCNEYIYLIGGLLGYIYRNNVLTIIKNRKSRYSNYYMACYAFFYFICF